MITVQNKKLAGKTLIVSTEIDQDNLITLDSNGKIVLEEEQGEKLLEVEGFSIVNNNLKKAYEYFSEHIVNANTAITLQEGMIISRLAFHNPCSQSVIINVEDNSGNSVINQLTVHPGQYKIANLQYDSYNPPTPFMEALIVFNGTNAPEFNVLRNNTGINFQLIREGMGLYLFSGDKGFARRDKVSIHFTPLCFSDTQNCGLDIESLDYPGPSSNLPTSFQLGTIVNNGNGDESADIYARYYMRLNFFGGEKYFHPSSITLNSNVWPNEGIKAKIYYKD